MTNTTRRLGTAASTLAVLACVLLLDAALGRAQAGSPQMPRDPKPQRAADPIKDEEQRLQRRLAADPASVSALGALGGFYNRTGQFETAIKFFQRAAALQPADPQAHHLLG